MLIEAMPELLTWTNSAEVLRCVHNTYTDLLSVALSKQISHLKRQDQETAEHLTEELSSASDRAFLCVLTAPETSFRLLERPCGSRESAEFLIRSLRAEKARDGERCEFTENTWTALGDMCFRADGSVECYPRLRDGLALDFGSPNTLQVDFGGQGNRPGEYREGFGSAERALIIDRIEAACAGIRRIRIGILEFVNTFNKVLICQRDPAAPKLFSSGSTGQYVGRSFVTNPHLDSVDEVELAEALVHEGIHALLYMQERCKAWIHDPDADRPVPLVDSPWSGTRLSVRSYLQACFVWYGLTHFWAKALTCSVFDAARARQRLSVAVFGFLGESVVDRLQPYRMGISVDLMDAIVEMQSSIFGVFAEVQTADQKG